MENFLSLVPIEDFEAKYSKDITPKSFFGFPIEPILKAEKDLASPDVKSVGYFSMEYGLSSNTYNALQSQNPVADKNFSLEHHAFSNMRAIDYYVSVHAEHRLDLPIYSGGLGVLAGDTLKSAADQGVSMAAVGILWHKGYFKQNFWFKDGQIPEENDWDPFSYPGLVPLKSRVVVPLKKESITLRLWKYYVYGFDKKHVVPLVLLDADVPENSESARKVTAQLYKSDNAEWKILQRVILGLGGIKAFEELRYRMGLFHLNEGHAALAFIEKTKNGAKFAYTCHTPVAAGHDRFPKKVLQETLRDEDYALLKKYGQDSANGDLINFTELAMNTCESVNAVAQKHGEVMRLQFPEQKNRILAITNGVHTHTWLSKPVAGALEKHKISIADVLSKKGDASFREDLWNAHQTNKKNLCALLKSWRMDPDVFTVAWARRIAAYKRPSLILQDAARLVDIAKKTGPIQILLAGKAHPKDDLGFTYVNEMLSVIDSLEKSRDVVRVVMLENYDTFFGKLLTSGVDIWLNNPLPPFEASGTSGMKALMNGVLQLSTLDGWVVEAAEKNVGWIFGWRHEGAAIGDERNLRLKEDSSELYAMLEQIITLYYETNLKGSPRLDSDWITKMIHALAAANFFNTGRMVTEYRQKIWRI